MSELLTMQDLANGHLDVKALGEAANGDENTIVTTRTGNTYPSAERAINIMFQNGGLPAKPFPTKAKMETDGASLADGNYAVVTNDTQPNNGIYVKTGGAWQPAAYNPEKTALLKAKDFLLASVAKGQQTFGGIVGITDMYSTAPLNVHGKFFDYEASLVSSVTVNIRDNSTHTGAKVHVLRLGADSAWRIADTVEVGAVNSNQPTPLPRTLLVENGDILGYSFEGGLGVCVSFMGKGLEAAQGEYAELRQGKRQGDVLIPLTTLSDGLKLLPERHLDTFEISYTTHLIDAGTHSRIDAADAILASKTESIFVKKTDKQGSVFTELGYTNSDAVQVNILAYTTQAPALGFGRVKSVRYASSVKERNILLKFYEVTKVEGKTYPYEITKIISRSARTDANGVAVFTQEDLKEIVILKGSMLLVAPSTKSGTPISTFKYSDTGKPPLTAWGYVYINGIIAGVTGSTGDNIPISYNNSQAIGLEITYEYYTSSGGINNALDVNHITYPMFGAQRYSTPIFNEVFGGEALPSGWTETGGWAVQDVGVLSPTTSTWTNILASPSASIISNRVYRLRFKTLTAGAKVALCSTVIEPNAGAAMAIYDSVANKFQLCGWQQTTASIAVAQEIDVPPNVVGTSYVIEVQKYGWFVRATLINTTTLERYEIEYGVTGSLVDVRNYVQFHGNIGISSNGSQVLVESLSFNGLYPKECHAIIIGDSNSERAGDIPPNGTWAYQLAELRRRQGDIIVAGRSGDETPNFLKRKEYDLKVWRPKYVIWALGTNDGSHATWRTNMQQNIADTLAIGAEPILTTIAPRSGVYAPKTAMDADIRNSYFGNYRYIDLASALSLNNDGVTWNPAYNSGDGVHYNQAGQNRVLKQALSDIPELLF